jgi:hypothetical protein
VAISDIYTARSAAGTSGTSAVPLLSLYGTAAKRVWIVGCRLEIQSAGATPAGNQILFQLARPNATNTGTSLASGNPQDFSAAASAGQLATTWSTAPAVGVILAEWTLPQTSGSSWEEFPPLGYEWGVPAIANANANAGVHLFATASNSTATSLVTELIWSE